MHIDQGLIKFNRAGRLMLTILELNHFSTFDAYTLEKRLPSFG
jgi:hypothetical protein